MRVPQRSHGLGLAIAHEPHCSTEGGWSSRRRLLPAHASPLQDGLLLQLRFGRLPVSIAITSKDVPANVVAVIHGLHDRSAAYGAAARAAEVLWTRAAACSVAVPLIARRSSRTAFLFHLEAPPLGPYLETAPLTTLICPRARAASHRAAVFSSPLSRARAGCAGFQWLAFNTSAAPASGSVLVDVLHHAAAAISAPHVRHALEDRAAPQGLRAMSAARSRMARSGADGAGDVSDRGIKSTRNHRATDPTHVDLESTMIMTSSTGPLAHQFPVRPPTVWRTEFLLRGSSCLLSARILLRLPLARPSLARNTALLLAGILRTAVPHSRSRWRRRRRRWQLRVASAVLSTVVAPRLARLPLAVPRLAAWRLLESNCPMATTVATSAGTQVDRAAIT